MKSAATKNRPMNFVSLFVDVSGWIFCFLSAKVNRHFGQGKPPFGRNFVDFFFLQTIWGQANPSNGILLTTT